MPTTMLSFFLYARKATEVEDKQALSIAAQLAELRQFAQREHLSVVAELIEKQSAKTPGRPLFNDMLARIEAGEAGGFLAWHPDRLAGNSVDGGRIIYPLDLETINSLNFPLVRFESAPQGKFLLNLMFGQSKYYVDSRSENTKRGLREKVRRGEYPGPAPLGYSNDYRTKRIIVDRERASVVREAFERYAAGQATLDTLRQFFASRGIRTQNGKLLVRAHVTQILSNPFYYGHFRYVGEVYEGKHKPIISKKLFDDVHAILNRRWRWSPQEAQRTPKAFMGLLHCAECGGAITAEVQKGHTYYRCTKKNKAHSCSQPYVREEVLDAEITALIKPFSLRGDWADAMLARVKEEERQSAQSSAVLIGAKRAEIQTITGRLQTLLDSFLDGIVDREAYTAKRAELMSRKKTLEEQIGQLAEGRAPWLEPFPNWILTAKNAGQIAISVSLPEKRVLAQQVFGPNLVPDGKKARGSGLKPWSCLLEFVPTGGMVRLAGLEPARVSPLPPQSSASANSATSAPVARIETRPTLAASAFSVPAGRFFEGKLGRS